MIRAAQDFIDKTDHVTVIKKGQVLDWTDKARIEDCKKRGLIEVREEKAKKPAKKVVKKEK